MHKFRHVCSVLAAFVLLSAITIEASALTIINFSQSGANASTGQVTYDGAGGPLQGTNISFDTLATDNGDGLLPAGNQAMLDCRGCLLDFTTGDNLVEGPANWFFQPGGTATLTGQVVDDQGNVIADNNLVDGTFTGNPSATQTDLTPGDGQPPASLIVSADGTDEKNDDLLNYFGLASSSEFAFSTIDISLAGTTFGSDGSFIGDIDAADLNNAGMGIAITPNPTPVPEPRQWALFGIGLVLLGLGYGYATRKYSNNRGC